MLSITGTTLEQFADLMQGLGYAAEKGEREKVKPADAAPAADPQAPADDASADAMPGDEGHAPAEAEAPAPAEDAAADALEVFYTFTWAPRPRRDSRPARKPEGEGRGPPQRCQGRQAKRRWAQGREGRRAQA